MNKYIVLLDTGKKFLVSAKAFTFNQTHVELFNGEGTENRVAVIPFVRLAAISLESSTPGLAEPSE